MKEEGSGKESEKKFEKRGSSESIERAIAEKTIKKRHHEKKVEDISKESVCKHTNRKKESFTT